MYMTPFSKKSVTGALLVAAILVTSCQDSPVSSIDADSTEFDLQSSSTGYSVLETPLVYVSDGTVLAYDHINVSTDPNWPTTTCNADGSIGLDDPRWTRSEGQTAFNIRPLLGGGLHAFEGWWSGLHHPNNFGQAEWINSTYKRYSTQMNPDGQGHNWTRYELPVDGNGTFELKLLADNCSWIYLDDELVGYQDDAGLDDVNNTRYGVTLDGPATLTYIIFDGGGDAGGKFRLETTTEDIPEFEPPTPANQDPVADAGTDQTVQASGAETTVTLDGTNSNDPDGDTLTYSWSNGSTSASTTVELGVGIHTYTLTVTDENGATDTDDVQIVVEDTTAPDLSYELEAGILWPPNHKLVLVASGISATDLVDGAIVVDVTVSSNESSNGRGDGNTDSDAQIISNPDGTKDVYVRSERSGKHQGRIYTIDLSSTDSAGNTTSESVEIEVAKNQGRANR